MDYTLMVEGMSCDHCVVAVTKELKEVPYVEDVSITLGGDDPSRVVVTAAQEPDRDKMESAVAAAGYSVLR